LTGAPRRVRIAAEAPRQPRTVTVGAAGRIVLGRATSPTILDMALARYDPDATLDAGFDGDGILSAEFGQDLALDSDEGSRA
jgi:hypothetical protein